MMTSSLTDRATDRSVEINDKIATMRRWLVTSQAAAIRLRGADWFAWATAGGSNLVLQAAETGVAEVLVTPQEAYILTDEIEAQRLQDEEVPEGFAWHVIPWAEAERRERFVRAVAAGTVVLSDRPSIPNPDETLLPSSCRLERMALCEREAARYDALGHQAALAMSEVLHAARPTWTEYELAGAGADALWGRGIHPSLLLAAGEDRLTRYRHPTPSRAPLGCQAMLVFCAQQHGLYANLTRFVQFKPRDLRPDRQHQAAIMSVEAACLDACTVDQPLSNVYRVLDEAYRSAGFPEAIRDHHQGGITGYLSREIVATPNTDIRLKNGMAVAFNPTLPGVKMEDTFLLQDGKLKNLTLDPDWPTVFAHGRMRPIPLEAS